MMKTFVKDYVGLCKETGKFYKKHWFGVAVMNVVTLAGTMVYYNKDNIKDKIDEKLHKKDDEGLA